MEPSKKLYVLVRKDMSNSQKAVQAGHAVAQFLIENPDTEWDNGTLVYLSCGPMYLMGCGAIEAVHEDLALAGCETASFREPYMDNKVTAIAAFGPKAADLLKDFRLLYNDK